MKYLNGFGATCWLTLAISSYDSANWSTILAVFVYSFMAVMYICFLSEDMTAKKVNE